MPSHPARPEVNFDIVVVGASAGGLSAIERVVRGLPNDFAAAMVIVLHLSPAHPSYLAEILRRCTTLDVRPAQPGDAVVPGTIVTALPGQHVVFTPARTIDLSDSPKVNYARPSVDSLFGSAAEVYGDRVIAVVLSGTGHDGRDGTYAIRRAGGVVIAQSAKTSEHTGMPSAALHGGSVDLVLDISEIAGALHSLVSTGRYGEYVARN